MPTTPLTPCPKNRCLPAGAWHMPCSSRRQFLTCKRFPRSKIKSTSLYHCHTGTSYASGTTQNSPSCLPSRGQSLGSQPGLPISSRVHFPAASRLQRNSFSSPAPLAFRSVTQVVHALWRVRLSTSVLDSALLRTLSLWAKLATLGTDAKLTRLPHKPCLGSLHLDHCGLCNFPWLSKITRDWRYWKFHNSK